MPCDDGALVADEINARQAQLFADMVNITRPELSRGVEPTAGLEVAHLQYKTQLAGRLATARQGRTHITGDRKIHATLVFAEQGNRVEFALFLGSQNRDVGHEKEAGFEGIGIVPSALQIAATNGWLAGING